MESCLNTLHKFYWNIFLFAFVDCLCSYGTLVKLNQYRCIIWYYWRQFSLISIIREKLHILARATCAISLCRQVSPADCFQSTWKAPVKEAAAVSSLTSNVIPFICDISKQGFWDPEHMKGFLLTVSESLRSVCSLIVIIERLIQWLHVFIGLEVFFPFPVLWEKMKEEPNYSRIKLLYMKDTSLWLWTLIPLENTETIILIYHAGSDDATHWMKGCKTIIIYVYIHTPIWLVRKWKECYNSC